MLEGQTFYYKCRKSEFIAKKASDKETLWRVYLT